MLNSPVESQTLWNAIFVADNTGTRYPQVEVHPPVFWGKILGISVGRFFCSVKLQLEVHSPFFWEKALEELVLDDFFAV